MSAAKASQSAFAWAYAFGHKLLYMDRCSHCPENRLALSQTGGCVVHTGAAGGGLWGAAHGSSGVRQPVPAAGAAAQRHGHAHAAASDVSVRLRACASSNGSLGLQAAVHPIIVAGGCHACVQRHAAPCCLSGIPDHMQQVTQGITGKHPDFVRQVADGWHLCDRHRQNRPVPQCIAAGNSQSGMQTHHQLCWTFMRVMKFQ